MDQVFNRIQSRKLARALGGTARTIRATWTATDKRFARGRYRWYRTGLRAEIMRLTLASPAWPAGIVA